MGWKQIFGNKPLPLSCIDHARADELFQTLVVDMLQLTPTASAEMGTRCFNEVGSTRDASILRHMISGCRALNEPTVFGNAVAFRGKIEESIRKELQKELG